MAYVWAGKLLLYCGDEPAEGDAEIAFDTIHDLHPRIFFYYQKPIEIIRAALAGKNEIAFSRAGKRWPVIITTTKYQNPSADQARQCAILTPCSYIESEISDNSDRVLCCLPGLPGTMAVRFSRDLAGQQLGSCNSLAFSVPDRDRWIKEDAAMKSGGASPMPLMFRRDDGAPLSGSDIDRGIHLVHLAFSFLRGGLVAPFLIEKFDREWTFCGTRYYAPMYDASQPGPGWSRGISAENFRKYIQSFLAAASDQAVLDRLKSIIPWYCQANPISSFKPTSIVLGQIALEAVAWGAARSGPLPLSPEGYKKLPAADKIRVALLRHGISACPASMFSGTVQSSVRQLAEKNRDVVGLLVDLRNALVHAEPSKHVDPSAISGIDLLHIHDASQQLVEMLLLREIGYNEEIFRRSVGSQYEDV